MLTAQTVSFIYYTLAAVVLVYVVMPLTHHYITKKRHREFINFLNKRRDELVEAKRANYNEPK